jgi:hypothetical protein
MDLAKAVPSPGACSFLETLVACAARIPCFPQHVLAALTEDSGADEPAPPVPKDAPRAPTASQTPASRRWWEFWK